MSRICVSVLNENHINLGFLNCCDLILSKDLKSLKFMKFACEKIKALNLNVLNLNANLSAKFWSKNEQSSR